VHLVQKPIKVHPPATVVVVNRMTRSETKQIRRALELLRQLLPNEEQPAADRAAGSCPVTCFAKRHLRRDPTTDLTSAELWRFFSEVADSGEVRRLPKAEFQRRLPAVMERLFGSLKSHNIQRAGHRVRGFRGVEIRLDDYALESESAPGRASTRPATATASVNATR
jgi:hypothetical protein